MNKHPWMDKVDTINNFHKEKLRSNPKHKVTDTAKELNMANGRASEYLQLAVALKDPELKKKLERFKYVEDALGFLKDHRKEMRMI